MSVPPSLIVTHPPRAVAAGVFVSEGTLALPNSLRLAYKLWTNSQDIASPIEKQQQQQQQQANRQQQQQTDAKDSPNAAASSANVAAAAATAADSRFNILALPSAGSSLCNASSFDALAPAVLHALSPACMAAPPRCVVFLALEYAGTGLSQPRPRDGNYAATHDVADVMLMLSRVLRWSECAIVGHGLGARIAALLAASDALQITPPAAAAALPRPTRLLGCALLDPFPYQSWALDQASDEDYANMLHLQSDPDALKRSIAERRRLQRTRKTMFKTFDEAVAAHLESDRDGEVSEESVRVLLRRSLKLVKRPLVSPQPESLATMQGALDDERELQLPLATTTAAASSASAAAPPMPGPVPGRDFDPRVEEVGYVCRSDPLRAGSPSLLGFSRASISAALCTLRCRALMLHARTQASSNDRAFGRHIDALVHGSSGGESTSYGAFSLPHGAGLGAQRDIVGDHHLHLDPDSAQEVSAVVGEFCRDAWNDRANTRRERAEQEHSARRHAKEARQAVMQAERRFLHEAPGSHLGPLADAGLVSRL